MQFKNCDFRAGVIRKFSTLPHAFYTVFSLLSVLTAHITSSQRPGLPLIRVCVQRSLQPSSVEAFGSCCYAYNNSYRPGLRTANAALAHPRVPADARISAHPRETFGYKGTPSRPWAAGAAAPGEHGPFKFQLCGGGQHRWRRGAGLGPGPLPVRGRESGRERESSRTRESSRGKTAGAEQQAENSAQPCARGGSGSGAAVPRGGGEDEDGSRLFFLPPRDDFHSNLIERCNFGNWGGFIIIFFLPIFSPRFVPPLAEECQPTGKVPRPRGGVSAPPNLPGRQRPGAGSCPRGSAVQHPGAAGGRTSGGVPRGRGAGGGCPPRRPPSSFPLSLLACSRRGFYSSLCFSLLFFSPRSPSSLPCLVCFLDHLSFPLPFVRVRDRTHLTLESAAGEGAASRLSAPGAAGTCGIPARPPARPCPRRPL